MKNYLILTLLLSAACGLAVGQTPSKGDEVVKEMAKRFRIATTYQTSGSLATVGNLEPYKELPWAKALTETNLRAELQLSFLFAFKRPDNLRFDWLSIDSKQNRWSSIWTNGKKSFSWLLSSGETDGRFVWNKETNLRMLLQQADFNHSSSMASILFSQLTGHERAFTFDEMGKAEIVREDAVDGRACYVVLGTISNDPWALWIDKSTFILRKMRLQISLSSFDETVETGVQKLTIGEVKFSDPRIEVPVPPSTFEYKPILKKKDINLSKY